MPVDAPERPSSRMAGGGASSDGQPAANGLLAGDSTEAVPRSPALSGSYDKYHEERATFERPDDLAKFRHEDAAKVKLDDVLVSLGTGSGDAVIPSLAAERLRHSGREVVDMSRMLSGKVAPSSRAAAELAQKTELAQKRRAAKEAVAALGQGWKGGGSCRISMNLAGGEFISQTDDHLADALVATDGDAVRYGKASARFKHCIPLDCDHMIVMKIQGTACQVGLCGEMYDPERDGATNAHTMGIYLDTGTSVINSEMVLDSKRYFHHKLLAPYLPYRKILQEKEKALQDEKEASMKRQETKADAQKMVAGSESGWAKQVGKADVSRADLRPGRGRGVEGDAADLRPGLAAKARREESSRLAREKLKKRQRSGMAAPRMDRAQVSAFTGRNNGSESSKLDPRFDSVGLEVNDGIRRAYGPNDMSWNQETWVIIKCEPTPVVMFDEHGLGHWQPMSTKSVPYRMAGYGGTGFLYYPFVELFSGAKVLETKIISTAQFERRKQHGSELIRATKMAEDIAITGKDMKTEYKPDPIGSGVSSSLRDELMKQQRTPTPSSLVRPDSW